MSDTMITIKKADGTFAKVPLSEFKKNQAGKKPVEVAKSVGQSTPTHSRLPQRAGSSILENRDKRGINEGHKSTHYRPAHHKSAHHQIAHHVKKSTINNIQYPISNKPHHPAKSMSRSDASSPLEEKLKTKSSAPLTSPKREKQVEEVLGKLGFSVVPEVLGRLKSLVLAKLKDIKSEDETRELLARSIKNGGLGLTEQQVEKIIKSCREVEGGENTENTDAPVLKGKSGSMLPMIEPPELPMVISPPPLSKRGQGELPKTALGSATSATPSSLPLGKVEMTVAKMVNESMANEPIFKLDTRPAMKQSMQDVTASDVEMGPVEEIKSVTLTDFRRLSGNPAEAAKRLQQKMFNLQEESFVWYLDALAAYHNSPLYSEYMQAVCQSLAERKSLANVLAMKNSIKLNEVEALMEMEKTL